MRGGVVIITVSTFIVAAVVADVAVIRAVVAFQARRVYRVLCIVHCVLSDTQFSTHVVGVRNTAANFRDRLLNRVVSTPIQLRTKQKQVRMAFLLLSNCTYERHAHGLFAPIKIPYLDERHFVWVQ